MKKLILSLIIVIVTLSTVKSQDIIGGEISVWYDNLGSPFPMVMMLKMKLYTKASQNVNRPTVNVHSNIVSNIYTTLPKVSDTIIGNDVEVPSGYYKIIYDAHNDQMAAYVIKQYEDLTLPISDYQVPVDFVEILTGFNFYPQMAEGRQQTLEASIQWGI